MNEGIELHDSELAAVSFSGSETVVSLSPAYIHRSEGRPGVDSGSGWSQRATLTFAGTLPVAAPTPLPAIITDGFLRIGGTVHTNVIPACGTFEGSIELCVDLGSAQTWSIRGERISIQLHDEPVYVETFNLGA